MPAVRMGKTGVRMDKFGVLLLVFLYVTAAGVRGQSLQLGVGVEVGDPDTEVVDPDADVGDPDTDAGDPDTDVGDQDTDAGDPDTDVAYPDTDVADPDIDVADPDTDVADPDTDVADPDSDVGDPDTDVADPHTDVADTDTEVADPGVDENANIDAAVTEQEGPVTNEDSNDAAMDGDPGVSDVIQEDSNDDDVNNDAVEEDTVSSDVIQQDPNNNDASNDPMEEGLVSSDITGEDHVGNDIMDESYPDDITSDQNDSTSTLEGEDIVENMDTGEKPADDLSASNMDPAQIPRLPVSSMLAECSASGGGQCNETAWERCVPIRGRTTRCDCISGHARLPTGQCVAIKLYRGRLATQEQFGQELTDTSSARYRSLEYHAREVLHRAVAASRLRALAVSLHVAGLSRTASGHLAVDFELLLSRSYAPDDISVRRDLQQGLVDNLDSDPGAGQTGLQDTAIDLSPAQIDQLQLTAPDPCSDPLLNYCHEHALCLTTRRSFTCGCRPGYEDVSPSRLEAPGERCALHCDCRNGGSCELDGEDQPTCRCPSWYLGRRCEHDGKVLLLCVGVVLGVLLLIAISCCACCLYQRRRRNRRHHAAGDDRCGSTDAGSVPGSKGHEKSPWMDTWRYYRFSPPPYSTYRGAPGGTPYRAHPAMLPYIYSVPTQPVYRDTRRASLDGGVPNQAGGHQPYQVTIPRPQVDATLPRGIRHYRPTQWQWSSSHRQT